MDDLDDLDNESFLSEEMCKQFPVLSQIVSTDWKGTCRYIIGDNKPDSIFGMRYELSPDGVCTMTTTMTFGDGKTHRHGGNQVVNDPIDDNRLVGWKGLQCYAEALDLVNIQKREEKACHCRV